MCANDVLSAAKSANDEKFAPFLDATGAVKITIPLNCDAHRTLSTGAQPPSGTPPDATCGDNDNKGFMCCVQSAIVDDAIEDMVNEALLSGTTVQGDDGSSCLVNRALGHWRYIRLLTSHLTANQLFEWLRQQCGQSLPAAAMQADGHPAAAAAALQLSSCAQADPSCLAAAAAAEPDRSQCPGPDCVSLPLPIAPAMCPAQAEAATVHGNVKCREVQLPQLTSTDALRDDWTDGRGSEFGVDRRLCDAQRTPDLRASRRQWYTDMLKRHVAGRNAVLDAHNVELLMRWLRHEVGSGGQSPTDEAAAEESQSSEARAAPSSELLQMADEALHRAKRALVSVCLQYLESCLLMRRLIVQMDPQGWVEREADLAKHLAAVKAEQAAAEQAAAEQAAAEQPPIGSTAQPSDAGAAGSQSAEGDGEDKPHIKQEQGKK